MNIARQIAKYEDKGFTRERAEVNTLIEHAAVTIFRDFPEAFVLFGGATLVLYHDSVRHSADLDLLSRTALFPSPEEIHILVAGGTAGRFSVAIPGWLGTKNGSRPITRAVEMG